MDGAGGGVRGAEQANRGEEIPRVLQGFTCHSGGEAARPTAVNQA